MKTYILKSWQSILQRQQLTSFAAIWNLEKNWFEDPNWRRGGWSGVCRIELTDDAGEKKAVFLKRQSNHTHASLRYPFKGRPTFNREFCNIKRLQRCNIPTIIPIYYAQHKRDVILMSAELTGYYSLEQWIAIWTTAGFPERSLRTRIIIELANITRRLHKHHYKHGSFKFKHIFLNLQQQQIKISIIDLEQLRYWPVMYVCSLRDLFSLSRDAINLSLSDRWRFIKAYVEVDDSKNSKAKKLWRQLQQKHLERISKKAAG